MKKCGVYLLVNAISNKNYVGSSTRLSQRISEHLSLLKKGKHYNFLMQKDANLYGVKNFFSYTIEYVSNKNVLQSTERRLIEKYNAHYLCGGYNLTYNTNSSSLYADKIKNLKIKQKAWKGINNPMYKMGIKNYWINKFGPIIGIKKWNRLLEINSEKNSGLKNAMYGKIRNDLSEFNIKSKSKVVLQFDLNNNFIQEWKSVSEASRILKLKRRSIANFINSNQGIACGFKWKYKQL